MYLPEVFHKAVEELAFKHLLQKARCHSKAREELYPDLKGMEYMRDPRFTSENVNTLFRFRTRMFNVKNNFRNQYKAANLSCPLCKTSDDSQEHLFQCVKIRNRLHQSNQQEVLYDDIFTNDCNKLLAVVGTLMDIVRIREEMEGGEVEVEGDEEEAE